jgi:hypothetical protein
MAAFTVVVAAYFVALVGAEEACSARINAATRVLLQAARKSSSSKVAALSSESEEDGYMVVDGRHYGLSTYKLYHDSSDEAPAARPRIYMGVLAGTGDSERMRRDAYRRHCVPKLTPLVKEGLLIWNFFVGKPLSHSDSSKIFQADQAHTQGYLFSKESHDEAKNILAEYAEHGDIHFVNYADQYMKVGQKTIDLMRIGSQKQNSTGWLADFVVKSDVDTCFQYDVFSSAIDDYRKKRFEKNTVSMLYRHFSSGIRLGLPNLNFIPFYGGIPNKATSKFLTQNQTESDALPVVADLWWVSPYDSVKGSKVAFEPYPSGPLYVVPRGLAERFTQDPTTIVKGQSSEDVNFGYLLRQAAEKQGLEFDLMSLGDVAKGVS